MFKLSGRYWLNDTFSDAFFPDTAFGFRKPLPNSSCHPTVIYSVPFSLLPTFESALQKVKLQFQAGVTMYEYALPQKCQPLHEVVACGVSGLVAIDGIEYNDCHRICILDPAAHCPSLKQLFPRADYYAHSPDAFFHHCTTKHYTPSQFHTEYGFQYRTDWNTITSANYDTVLVCVPLADYFQPISHELDTSVANMSGRIETLLNKGTFRVGLLDTYDYDYDPSKMNTRWRVDVYWKRNMNSAKSYAPNVHPFPFMMFVKPCVLGMVLQTSQRTDMPSIPKALWAGGVYNHVDTKNGVYRMRKDMFDAVSNMMDSVRCSESEYKRLLGTYKIGVDLIGVGDPNKRTFEILFSGSLLFTQCKHLMWGFEDGDGFHPNTMFETAEEFKQKLRLLLEKEDMYQDCMNQQRDIVKKYFHKTWLRNRICKYI
jgi:hypothetical protein